MYQRVAKYVLPVELLPERERQDLQLPLLLVKVVLIMLVLQSLVALLGLLVLDC